MKARGLASTMVAAVGTVARLIGMIAMLFSSTGAASSATDQKAITIYTKAPYRSELGGTSAELLELARNEGTIRVNVGLSVPFRADAAPSSREESAQKQAIRQAQRRVTYRIFGTFAASSDDWFEFIPYMVMRVDAGRLAKLLDDPDVESVQLGVSGTVDASPAYTQVSDHTPMLQSTDDLINAVDLWRREIKGYRTFVAVLDTAVDQRHNMFAGKVASGLEACFSTNSSSKRSLCRDGATAAWGPGSGILCTNHDQCSHGTHVAGIALGRDESRKIYGVAPGAALIPIQVFHQIRSTGQLSFDDTNVARGLQEVVRLRDRRVPVVAVNLSFSTAGSGGTFAYPCNRQFPILRDKIAMLTARNVAVVASTGNDGMPAQIGMPACLTDIAVGSSTKGVQTNFTGDNVDSTSNRSYMTALFAPGKDIVSASPGNRYIRMSGTSMAAPQVAGAIALLRQVRPSVAGRDLLKALTCNGKILTNAQSDTGPLRGLPRPFPRIDLVGAYNWLMQYPRVTRSWLFTNRDEFFDWSPMRGNWRVAGGYLQPYPLVSGVVATRVSACSTGGRIVARLRRTDPEQYLTSGIFIGWRSYFGRSSAGYYATFNTCRNSVDRCYRKSAGIYRYSFDHLGRPNPIGAALCEIHRPIVPGSFNTLDLEIAAGRVTFRLNGQIVCFLADPNYDYEHYMDFGLLAEIPSNLRGQTLSYDSVSVTTRYVAPN